MESLAVNEPETTCQHGVHRKGGQVKIFLQRGMRGSYFLEVAHNGLGWTKPKRTWPKRLFCNPQWNHPPAGHLFIFRARHQCKLNPFRRIELVKRRCYPYSRCHCRDMKLGFNRHSKLGLVLQIVCFTALCAVCLVLGLVEHRDWLDFLAVCCAGAAVMRILQLRSKGRGEEMILIPPRKQRIAPMARSAVRCGRSSLYLGLFTGQNETAVRATYETPS